MADINLTTTAVSPTTIDRDDLRTRLRQGLHDEDSANYRWPDAAPNRPTDRAGAAPALPGGGPPGPRGGAGGPRPPPPPHPPSGKRADGQTGKCTASHL